MLPRRIELAHPGRRIPTGLDSNDQSVAEHHRGAVEHGAVPDVHHAASDGPVTRAGVGNGAGGELGGRSGRPEQNERR